MKRRPFLRNLSLATTGALLLPGCAGTTEEEAPPHPLRPLATRLLRTWSDALLAAQIHAPDDPSRHGMLWCSACGKVHGRCYDAVYPFLWRARETGEQRWVAAATALFDWADRNLTSPEGAWTVIPDPQSWKGTTVFGAISVAEALHHHAALLNAAARARWRERLGRAADYIYETFTLDFTHVNYGGTATYALWLLADVLDRPHYRTRAAELAAGIYDYFTPHDYLLFGEDKPARESSAKGLLPVDVGYNVEETLSALALYAVEAEDERLAQTVTRSYRRHVDLMLPDGAWDNSWGLRQNKWSYWGSRTCDGAQPGLVALAHREPVLAKAALRNLELQGRCTVNGLLAGGPHYASAEVAPCLHHSFTHAKALATVLDRRDVMATEPPVLPRAYTDGVDHVRDVDVYCLSRGPWCATVSCYDQVWKRPDSQAAAGASLGVLFHERLGLLCVASMADYVLVERNNMQPLVGEDIALTPRVEAVVNGVRYSNLYDLGASCVVEDEGGLIEVTCAVQLMSKMREAPPDGALRYELRYVISEGEVVIGVRPEGERARGVEARLVVPIVSPSGETVEVTERGGVRVTKPGGVVTVRANAAVGSLLGEVSARTFNHVPGVEALPLWWGVREGLEVVVGEG